jgi:hypothetical protein
VDVSVYVSVDLDGRHYPMCRNFVQKKKNNRNRFSEIIMDMRTYFPCKWGKIDFSRELPEKFTWGHNAFIDGIESSLCVENLCKRRKILKILYLRYRPMSESLFEKKIEVMFKKDDEDEL